MRTPFQVSNIRRLNKFGVNARLTTNFGDLPLSMPSPPIGLQRVLNPPAPKTTQKDGVKTNGMLFHIRKVAIYCPVRSFVATSLKIRVLEAGNSELLTLKAL
jgi:hypothetical protein